MAKLYMTFSDPVIDDGKLLVSVSCAVVGAVVPGLAFSEIFTGEPTPTAIMTAMRNKALQEVNAYIPTGKLTNGDIIMFAAPS